MKYKNNASPLIRSELHRVFLEFLKDIGAKNVELKQGVDDFVVGLKEPRPARNDVSAKLQSRITNVLSEVLRAWYRDSRYLTEEALPKPLALLGGKNSVAALIRDLAPDLDATALVEQMRKGNVIKRCENGRYVPTSQAVMLKGVESAHNSYLSTGVKRMLTIVRTNLLATRKSEMLMDRCAEILDLDNTTIQSFKKFSIQRGMSFLEGVDDWLETHRVGNSTSTKRNTGKRQGVRAAVQVIAYVDESGSKVKRPVPKSLRSNQRNKRAPTRAARA